MATFVNWVEAEYAGEFKSLRDALHDAVETAHERDADVTVVDEDTGAEWTVDVSVSASAVE